MKEQEVNKQEEIQESEAPTRKEYRKLLSPCKIPVDDTSHLAVDDLKFALTQGDTRNIAVTGHYGSGKSSVANTCISEMGIENKVLRISMSTFSLPTDSNNSGGDLYSDDIEYKIVQHLLYKCDKAKIPHSGFKQIYQPKAKDFSSYVAWILLAFVCFVIAIEPSVLRIDSFYYAYHKLLGEKAGWWVNLIADVCSIAYLLWFFFNAGKYLSSKLYQIRSVKIEAKGVKLEASKDVEVSVFNRYLDEIIYIIQSNQYDYILFEDLDRLDNSDRLFLKIRELNMLINESEVFKSQNRVVRFIYAIRDDVFTRELRTKCFDYIVAVVPVVDHYNVTDYLIKEYKKNGLFKTIETAVFEQLLAKVAGLRELKNIVNEYTLFEKSLQSHLSEDAENYEQKLLAVIIYKNLYPQDFAKAYLKQGLFYSVFNNKEQFYGDLTEELNEKLQTALKAMNESREKIVTARRQYLEKMNEGITVLKLIKDGYDYTPEQVATRDNLFELFANDGFDRYTYREDDHEIVGESDYDFSFDELGKKVTEDLDYYEVVHDDQEKYLKSNEERRKLEKDIKVIENTSLQELIKENGTEKAKSILTRLYIKEYSAKEGEEQTVNEDMIDTLQSMLYGGYITEDYYLYISKFYEGSTSESDYQFTNAILQGAERPYDHKLNSPKTVVGKLRVEDFKNKSILNYDILNFLLESKQDHFLSAFVETARQTPEFIVSYFQTAEPVNKEFFANVFNGWDSCVNVIREQAKAENSEVLLKLFFREAPTTIKLRDEEIEYLNGRYDFIHSNIQFMDAGKLKKFVRIYNLCFVNLVKTNSQTQEFYNYCLFNKRFAINKSNMAVILGEDYARRPMTAMLGISNDRLKKYLQSNEKDIVKMFEETCDEEDRAALVYMMKEKVAEEEWLVNYIGKQLYAFDDVSGLDKSMMDVVLKADKLVPKWSMVLEAFKIIGTVNNTLNAHLIKHAGALSKTKCEGDATLLRSLHEHLFLAEMQPMNEFKMLLRSFDISFTLEELQGMTDERIAEAIRQKKINASAEILGYLNESSTEQNADDYLIQHYDEFTEDGTLNLDDYMRNSMCIHILESKLTLTQKKYFLDNYVVIAKGQTDSVSLAKLVCFYYNQCDIGSARKGILIDALNIYQETDSWESKIKLVNKCNATWVYDMETENKLLKSLGGGYDKFTYPRGWANLDINEHNTTLIDFLKLKGHYISNVEEREGQYYVTFKHS